MLKKGHKRFCLVSAIATIFFLASCNKQPAPQIVNLWENDPPVSNNLALPESTDSEYWIYNVNVAKLHVYKASNNKSGKSVIICPGGGYYGLNMIYEGTEWARWFQQRGVTAIVLKYRTANGVTDVPFDDMKQTFRYMQTNAEELGVDPDKIGVVGFSAGGHLAAYASTLMMQEEPTMHPAFCVLVYSVITMEDEFTEKDSRKNLLGENLSEEEKTKYSFEKQITKKTPPTLIFANVDDDLVPVQNSEIYADSLMNKGIPVDIIVYPYGGHGWGSKAEFDQTDNMAQKMEDWVLDLK